MSDVHSANIDVCVPSAIAAHRERKARLKRIAARAVIPPPDPARTAPQQPPPEKLVPEQTTASHAEFCCRGWFARQEQLNPLPELTDAAAFPIRKVQQVCAIHYGVTVNDIVSDRRSKEIVRPRMVAIYLSKEMTKLSLPAVGRQFGNRDHSTVLHSIRKIERLSKTDTKLAADIAAIRELLS